MATSKGWIVAGIVIGGTLAIYLIARQKKKLPAKAAVVAPPAAGGAGAGAGSGTTGTTTSGPPGTGVYSKAGLTIRSSPELDNGWFGSGILDNVITSVATPGTFVGNIVSSTVDNNGDMDASGNIYTWYRINPAPTYGYAGGSYYVREDYITIK